MSVDVMSQSNSLDQAIEVSHEILQALDSSDVETVALLEEKRQVLIKDYYSSHSDIDAQQTSLLKQLNDDILKQLTLMQSKIRNQQSNLNKGSKASKAYLENT